MSFECGVCGTAAACPECREDQAVMAAEALYDEMNKRGEICPGCDCPKPASVPYCAHCRVQRDDPR